MQMQNCKYEENKEKILHDFSTELMHDIFLDQNSSILFNK